MSFFIIFAAMKSFLYVITLLLGLGLGACTPSAKVPEPAVAEHGRSVEGPSPKLSAIDSLMWHQPDSAFAMLQEFASSAAADSLDEFNGHYCQVLISELLYKNNYAQSNRKDLLKAVGYFDSITQVPEPVEGPSKDQIVFLDARAHYINGVGYYEQDSVVAACGEYLKALEIMETLFPAVETVCTPSLPIAHLPRFMGLTYSRLVYLFSGQYMQEPAIVCCKKALAFSKIEANSPLNQSRLLLTLGVQYDKLKQYDSATYYYNEAIRMLPDTNNLVFRNLVSQMALLNFNMGNDAELSISDMKHMMERTVDEKEKLTRYCSIGGIYFSDKQYDSALVYLIPVFENEEDPSRQSVAASCLHEIYQNKGDTVKATQFAVYLAENLVLEAKSNAQVSQLNDMFQQHLQWEQEKALAEERQAAKQRQTRIVVAIAVLLLALGLGLWWKMAKRRKEHETETQTLNEEKQQLQTQVDDALQQARAMLPRRVADLYRAKVPNRLERIMDEFEAAYPGAMERVATAYPDLSETERQIAVLNFLHFRAKEEADLLGLSENTVNKYRSNLKKKTENASLSSFLD